MNRHVRSRHPTVFKSEVTKRQKGDTILVDSGYVLTSETNTPYAIKTEEIYASDRDFEEIITTGKILIGFCIFDKLSVGTIKSIKISAISNL